MQTEMLTADELTKRIAAAKRHDHRRKYQADDVVFLDRDPKEYLICIEPGIGGNAKWERLD